MKYAIPELRLVGAAKGLVLGSVSEAHPDCLYANLLDSTNNKFSRDTPDFQGLDVLAALHGRALGNGSAGSQKSTNERSRR